MRRAAEAVDHLLQVTFHCVRAVGAAATVLPKEVQDWKNRD
jgi:hypothetical protein